MFTFSEKSQIILRDMGWFSERKVDPTIWVNRLQQAGYTVFGEVQRILEHLGGLHSNEVSDEIINNFILLSDATRIRFASHPNLDFLADKTHDSDRDSAPYWRQHPFIKRMNLDICPIGSIQRLTTLFIVSDGRIFTGDFYAPKDYDGENEASLIFLGNRIDEAIDKITERCIGYL